jgi:hypothetical protein
LRWLKDEFLAPGMVCPGVAEFGGANDSTSMPKCQDGVSRKRFRLGFDKGNLELLEHRRPHALLCYSRPYNRVKLHYQ